MVQDAPNQHGGLREIKTDGQSLVDQITQEVRRAIVEGQLRPGEPLSISTLSERLAISHIPIREALQRLAGQGSAVVAPLEVEDLKEVYRLRELVEVDAVARAVTDLTDADLAQLHIELDGMANRARDDERFWTHHEAFHLILMRPAMTPRLRRMIDDLWKAAERYIRLTYMEGSETRDGHSARERHVPLLEAAESRSPKRMRQALLEHLQRNEEELVERTARIHDQSQHKP
jgi:DNA-binding GntR family transcriptional regulator